MDAIGACFIGGTAITGGIGTIPGAMVGALIMGVLNQGLSIMGVDATWVKTIKGLVVIAAVAYDLLSKKRKAELNLASGPARWPRGMDLSSIPPPKGTLLHAASLFRLSRWMDPGVRSSRNQP